MARKVSKKIRVQVLQGTGQYLGIKYSKGDELEITERYFDANPGRFAKVAGRPPSNPPPVETG